MEKRKPLPEDPSGEFIHAVSGIFGCLGRALICLDRNLVVVHASDGLDSLAGDGAATEVLGTPAAKLFGEELFGEAGNLRRALLAGERREGWGAPLTIGDRATRPMSLTAAPISGIDSPLCDPRVAFLLVLRSAEDVTVSDTAPPTLFAGMVGRSSAMLRIFRLIQSLSESDSSVLVTGESGTGKELVAKALHLHSPRRAGPFVAVNCGALPGELLEAELFGHIRGAFTGAIRDRVGRFELANAGTLFLDEVGDLPLPLQVKLLRVLQERTYEPVGESRSRRTDARIIAATHRNLTREVAEGRFREDLYYRLRVVPIAIPPLRERREDVEPLALHLLARVGAHRGRALILAPDALRALLRYPWPGNARELENALEYAVAVCAGQTIHRGELPVEVAEADTAAAGVPATNESATAAPTAFATAATTGDAERQLLKSVLDAHRWNRDAAARALGISRTTLWRRLREAGLAG